MNQITQLHQDSTLVVVLFQARKITSSREIGRDEIDLDFSSLPDDVNAILRQNFLPDGALSEFKMLEKRARKYLHGRCLSTEIGYVVSPDEAIACVRRLDEIKTEYQDAANRFVNSYDQLLADAENKLRSRLSGWALADKVIDAVRRIAPSKEQIENRIGFEFQAIQVEPVSGFDADKEALLQSGLGSLRSGLYGKLICEVAKDAYVLRERVDERYQQVGMAKASQRSVQPLRDLYHKVCKLAFIDQRAISLRHLIEKAIGILPMSGPLTGQDYSNFYSIVKALSDQKGLVHHVEQGVPLFEVATAQDPNAGPAPVDSQLETDDSLASAAESEVSSETSPDTSEASQPLQTLAASQTLASDAAQSSLAMDETVTDVDMSMTQQVAETPKFDENEGNEAPAVAETASVATHDTAVDQPAESNTKPVEQSARKTKPMADLSF